ncbi:MAG: SMP-30/gluconolactonase/LRE family protein [Verrucomicrobiales bacterium]|nr:SMP-30/gluconolactonase/LRE family protein [Verrucomicrobiales bacterium]
MSFKLLARDLEMKSEGVLLKGEHKIAHLIPTLGLLLLLVVEAGSQEPLRMARIPGVVAAGAIVELVQEGFQFAEGPVVTPDGTLYFTDFAANRIYRMGPKGGIEVFREGANGANGLALDSDGTLLAAEMRGKRVIRMDSRGNVTPVAVSTAAGQPFLRPNDLIVDRRGGIYFTDPVPEDKPGKSFVYYIRPDGRVVLVSDDIRLPNGLTLTLDEKVLLVDDSLGDLLFAFDIQADGSARNKRTFARLQGIPEGKKSIADGMALDRAGRVYVTTLTGVQVFDASGKYLGTIPVPRQPFNLAFGGQDKRLLYIAAREGLYRLQMLSQGPDRPGK